MKKKIKGRRMLPNGGMLRIVDAAYLEDLKMFGPHHKRVIGAPCVGPSYPGLYSPGHMDHQLDMSRYYVSRTMTPD